MYTITALWTCAREQLDVTAVICNNRAYAILDLELARVGASQGGDRARSLLDLSRPDLDFVALATGLGVPATRATTAEELAEQLRGHCAEPGPHLIDAVLSSLRPGHGSEARRAGASAAAPRPGGGRCSRRRSAARAAPGGRCSASHRQASARSRAALRRPTASDGSPKPVPDRVFTSQNTTVPSAARSTRSSSPRAHRQLRASTVMPSPVRCSAASCSP